MVATAPATPMKAQKNDVAKSKGSSTKRIRIRTADCFLMAEDMAKKEANAALKVLKDASPKKANAMKAASPKKANAKESTKDAQRR